MSNIKLIATDLDGTFLKDDSTISKENLASVEYLNEKGIFCVAATGRNLKKVKEVIPTKVNFDYIIYSSGAGIYDWKNQSEMIHQNMDIITVHAIYDYLIKENLNFHAFYPAPENHNNWYHRAADCEEFERYVKVHQHDGKSFPATSYPEEEICQLLVIIPNSEENFQYLKSKIESVSDNLRVIRASSPFKTDYIWIEVFHHSVSKGEGLNTLCDILNINRKQTASIGNDYNDIDLLNFTDISYITNNAPKELKRNYTIAPTNEDHAFSYIVGELC